MQVQKPARYMGGEFNSVMKNPEDVDVRFAFLFPDTYEVGMSHLGMKILYHTINRRADAWCERVFSPWVDMAELMRKNEIPLFSLESRTPIRDFDILGITLQYEMSFTNILDALDLAGIPMRSSDRTDGPVRAGRRAMRVQSRAAVCVCGSGRAWRRRGRNASGDRLL